MATEIDHNAIKTRIANIIKSAIGFTEMVSVISGTGSVALYNGANTRMGGQIKSGNPMIGQILKKVIFKLHKTGSPTGTAYCEIYQGDTLKETLDTIDVSTIAVSGTEYAFEKFGSTYVMAEDDVVSIRYDGGNSSNHISVESGGDDSPIMYGANYTPGSGWIYFPQDVWIRMFIKDPMSFRSYDVGAPAGNIPNDRPMPYLFVTNDDLMEEDELTSTVKDNAGHTSTHTLRYLVIFMANGKNGRTVEKLLDDFGKTIKETIKANYHLADPLTGSDPKVASCWPEETRILNRDMIGTEIQGRVILLRCTAYTS